MMKSQYDVIKATKAQKDFCETYKVPMYAPVNGWCWSCGKNIYEPYMVGGRIVGITAEAAGKRMITSCPHCHATFVD